MDFDDVERGLRSCAPDRDDSDAARDHKREHRRRLERDLAALLEREEPTADQAYRLAQILTGVWSWDLSPLERAQELARRALDKSHPDAGPLVARCVDGLLSRRGLPQRYGTLRFTSAGEVRFPDVDLSVSDSERASLGLPPLAQAREEVAGANRAQARRVADEGLPAGANLRRVERDHRPADIEAALAGRQQAVWRDDDDIVFGWRGAADAVSAWFGVQPMSMERLVGTDLWVLAIRIRDVDRAAFSYRFHPAPADAVQPMAPLPTWQGPLAPPPPERARPARGELRTVDRASETLGEVRRLQVYLPPGHDPRDRPPVLYATDCRTSADLIEPLIISGQIPPVISIGVPFGPNLDGDRRAQEYLPGLHPDRFEAHRRFFVDELATWAEDELGAATDRSARAVFGVSNGAAFAAAMGVRHPEHFGTVIAFSLGVTAGSPQWQPGEAPSHYLCAGTLEEGFGVATERWAQRASRAGAHVVHRTWVSGHDPVMWDGELPAAVTYAFGPRTGERDSGAA